MGMVSATLKLVDQMSSTLKKIQDNLKNVNDKLKDTQKESNKIPQIFNKWTIAIGGVLGNLITKIGSLGVSIVKAGITFNTQIEDLTSNFRVMLGSVDLAKAKVQELYNFASVTPFNMGDLAQSTKTLLAFGVEGEHTTSVLKMLGDIALGDKNRLKSLALVFGQIMSAGKLMGQDLLQLINVGFNPLQIISQQTGKSMGELREEMSKGAISSQMVAQAFKDATSEGGLFFNGMAEGAKTFKGVYSTMMDKLNSTLGKLFEPLTNALYDLMKAVSTVLDIITPLIEQFTNFINQNAEAIKVVLLVLGAVAIATAIKVATAWIVAHLPIILIIGLVSVAIYGLIKILSFFGVTTNDVLGFVSGIFNSVFTIVCNILIDFGNLVLSIVNVVINAFGTLANFLGNVFKNPLSSIIKMFEAMSNSVLGILKGIASVIDTIFGSNLASAVSKWQSKVSNSANDLIKKYAPNENYKAYEKKNITMESLGFQKKSVTGAYIKGYEFGSKFFDNLKSGKGATGLNKSTPIDAFIDSLNKNNQLGAIGKGVKGINDKLGGKGSLKSVGETKIKDENLKYLQDIAQLKYLQEYQKTESQKVVNVSVSTGDINSGADENQLTRKIVNNIIDALDNNLVGA